MDNVASNTNTAPKYNPQEYIDLADKSYLDFIKDGKYKDILKSMTTLGDYTLRNQMLILQQQPSATKVNNMDGWNFRKRSIVKGSQSIKILAPVFDSVVTVDNGNVTTKQSEFVSGYKMNFVFDISQTEAKANTEDRGNEPTNCEPYFDIITKALKDTLKSYEIVTANIEKDGILDTRRKTITLKEGMDEKHTLKTLIDQVAAALILGRDRNKFQGLREDSLPSITAVEITAASDIVARRLGLESQNVIEPDFKDMTDEAINKFANNIGVIRSVSQLMIKAAENAMTAVQAEEKAAETLAALDEIPMPESAPAETTTKTVTKTTTKVKTKAVAEMG